MHDDDEVLIELAASPGRRIFACGVTGLLGAMLIWLASVTLAVTLWGLFLLAAGGVAIWMAWWQFQVTVAHLELTRTELRMSTGTRLVAVDDIVSVDRGALAIKPSQGFTVRTRSPQPRGWAPGLYWRFGRMLGIGGVTNAGQGKAMAEIIQALIAERDGT